MTASETRTRPQALPTDRLPDGDRQSTARHSRVAYIMSWFPKLTETFVLREMLELEKLGFHLELYPLRKGDTNLLHDDARPYVERAHFTRFFSWGILLANLLTLLRRPLRYVSTLVTLVRANWGSRRYLTAALLFFPKAVYLGRLMRQRGIEHVHAHFASHPAAVAFVIERLNGIGYSFTAHGSDLHRDQHMLREKTVAARFVVAISQYNRDMILEVCGAEVAPKVHVVHCGIDHQKFSRARQSTPYDQGQGPFRILCIGTLHEVKGQKYLIEACSRLHQRQVEFTCHLLGAGPDESQLRQQVADLGLDSQVIFHGYCEEKTVREQLRLADVLVAPSVFSRDGRREGIPVVLMEAMSCEVPCVASAISGIPELIEDRVSGWLTPPGDSAAIAEALVNLREDAQLRGRLAEAGLQQVRSEFDLSTNATRLGELFDAAVPADAGTSQEAVQ